MLIDSLLIIGAGTGLIKTIPDHEVPTQGSVAGFLHKTLESGKMGQGLFLCVAAPRTVPARVIM